VPFPPGHFYSPVVDPAEIRRRAERIWPEGGGPMRGVDLRLEQQAEFLRDDVATYLADFHYPRRAEDAEHPHDFHLENGMFERMDPLALFAMLRRYRPKRMVEVGSGFSSLLTADVNRRFLDGALEFACIEPYPRDFLRHGVPGMEHLIEAKVEEVDPAIFETLHENDVLFIDSSHVAKTGSDVNFLYFDVIPRLASGVIIHVHDIFFPQDYPPQWVIGENRSWNEQYLLQAMLMYTHAFEPLFGSACAMTLMPDLVESVCGDLLGGGSFWMRKTVDGEGGTR